MDFRVNVWVGTKVGVEVDVIVGVSVWVGRGVAVSVDVNVGTGVNVGPKNCPGPQPEAVKLMTKTRMSEIFLFIGLCLRNGGLYHLP